MNTGVMASMRAVTLPMTLAGAGILVAGASMRAGDEEGGAVGALVHGAGGIGGIGLTVGAMMRMQTGLGAIPTSSGAVVAATVGAGMVGMLGLAGVGLAVRQ